MLWSRPQENVVSRIMQTRENSMAAIDRSLSQRFVGEDPIQCSRGICTKGTFEPRLRPVSVRHYQVGNGFMSGWLAIFMGPVSLKIGSAPEAQFDSRPGKVNFEGARCHDEILRG